MTFTPVSVGSGPALALAHGAGGGVADNFMMLSTHLKSRTLIGVDYPGSGGRLPAASPIRVADLADELVAAAVAAGHERFPALGLSLGSTVAITAAARHPERISGLVLVVGFATSDPQSRAFAELYASLARANRIDDLSRLLLLSTGSPAKLAKTAPTTVDLLADYHRGRAAGLAPQMDLVRSVNVSALLPSISVPTLVVAAAHDRIVLASSTRALADQIPGAQYVEYDGAGHLFTPAESARLAGDVKDFLARHDI